MAALPISFPIPNNKNEKADKLLLLSRPEGKDYYLLQYNSPPDNRYTPEFVDAHIEALVYLKTQVDPPLPLVTTSTSAKFFSNGLDFERALATENFIPDRYYRLLREYILFPWPTIAWINGHAFAAAFMLALANDYRVMNPDRGFLCANEVEFGAPLLGPMMSIFRVRAGSKVAQKITQTAHRFTSAEALEVGLIDARGGLAEVEEYVEKYKRLAGRPSYGQIRSELLREVVKDTRSYFEAQDALQKSSEIDDQFYDKISSQITKKLKSNL